MSWFSHELQCYAFKNNNYFLNFGLLPQESFLLSGYTGIATSLKYTLTVTSYTEKKSPHIQKEM